jgi:hypothetical protein
MYRLPLLAISISMVAIAGTSGLASAQETTHAQVRQELIQAEHNGLRFVTDASYPEVASTFEAQVTQRKTAEDSEIEAAATEADRSAEKATAPASDADGSLCVGPVSFCTPFFGG